MDGDELTVYDESHPPGQVAGAAVGLLVDEVAPSTHDLSDEQAHNRQVSHGQEGQLFIFAHHQAGQDTADDAAVDGQTAIPDGDGLAPLELPLGVPIEGQVEYDVVNAGTDNADGQPPQEHIQKVILFDAEILRPPAAKSSGQQEASGDDDAVPVDVLAENLKGHPLDVEGQSQAGEGDGIHVVPSFGFTTDIAAYCS